MKDVSQVTALVIDHGLHIPLARHLGQTFKRVLYWSPWETGSPTVNDCVLGDGFPEIERVDDFWRVMPEVDLVIFPDVGHAGLQHELEAQGKAVWGSRHGSDLETKREKFHKILGDLGLEVPPFTKIKGLTNLRVFLKDKEEKFIKISKYRGSFETCKFRNYDVDQKLLDGWAVQFGPVADLITFLVFDKIETNLELGGDTFNVMGQFPELMMNAYEKKDEGLFAAVTARADMPDAVQEVMEAFAPVLKEFGYRNAWSMEIRAAEDKNYFIDPCCRYPRPATASQLTAFDNLPEIIWHGAQGELVQPHAVCNFVIEVLLDTGWEKGEWNKVRFPKELGPHIQASSCCQVDGAICWPPRELSSPEMCWLVAGGKTIPDTIKLMQERIELLPDGVSAKTQALFDLLKEIHEGEEQGIQFTEETVPEPATVLEQS